jgi:hypothetical protein
MTSSRNNNIAPAPADTLRSIIDPDVSDKERDPSNPDESGDHPKTETASDESGNHPIAEPAPDDSGDRLSEAASDDSKTSLIIKDDPDATLPAPRSERLNITEVTRLAIARGAAFASIPPAPQTYKPVSRTATTLPEELKPEDKKDS